MRIRNQIIMNAVESAKPRRKAMVKIKPSVVAVYASIFALIVAMVSIGYQEPQKTSVVANATNANSLAQSDKTSVDNVVATGVAAGVAQITNLPIATSVTNLAVSAQTKSDFAQFNSTNTAKPQIIESEITNRKVISYTAKTGDTVGALATKFGITAQTIKWANDLTSDELSEGEVLKILPIDGVLYDVQSADTIDSIVSKYGVEKTRMVLYNDLEVSGLEPNTSIILPNGILPENERPGYVAPYIAPVASIISYGFVSSGNDYAFGYCTWYAYQRRLDLGNPVSSSLGNANTWALRSPTGYDHEPSAGAVLVDESGWLGHVAVVESVVLNDHIVISEMNNSAYGGWNIVNNRTISYGQAVLYKYIH